jgi:photosystem II stability/assembly factor-like uncharacterized protein
MRVLIGISGESLSNRVEPPDTYGTGLYACDDLELGEWTRVSGGLPDDPEVRTIAVTGSRVLIGTQYGVHASDDRGHTWRTLAAPTPQYGVWSLAVHPRDPRIVLAGYEPAAVHRSDDGGASWHAAELAASYPRGTESEPKRVIGLAFDPDDPEHVYGAVEVGGFIVSRDGGRSWCSAPASDADAADAHAVIVAKAGVLACTRVGVIGSTNRGDSWHEVFGEHMVARGVSAAELASLVDRVSNADFDGNVYVDEIATDASGAVRFGLWARRASRIDYGDAFDPLARGARRDAEGRVRAGVCLHAVIRVLEALFASHPGATVTTSLAELSGRVPPGLANAAAGQRCDCNSPASTLGPAGLDAAGAWIVAQPYLRAVSALGDEIWVGAGCGYMSRVGTLYRSRDGGHSWQSVALPTDTCSGIFAVARTHGGIVCAARDGQVFWSIDDGATWRGAHSPPRANPIYALAVT